MTTIREFQVTFDCADPGRVSSFWCQVLGYEQQGPQVAVDPSGQGPRMYFQAVPEGKVVKNQVDRRPVAVGQHLGQGRVPDRGPQHQFDRQRVRAHGGRRRGEPHHDVGVPALRRHEALPVGLAQLQLTKDLLGGARSGAAPGRARGGAIAVALREGLFA